MIYKKYIHYLQKKEWPLLKRFIKKSFHGKYILADKRFFDWQYNTFNTTCDTTAALLIFFWRDKVLGHLGVIPFKINYFGNEVLGACLANLMTHHSIRNKGVGVDFIEKASEEYSILYTIGYTPAVGVLYKHLGWERDFLLKRFIKILNANRVSQLAGKEIRVSNRRTSSLSAKDIFTFEEIQLFDDKIDIFWNIIKHKYPITVMRSATYLNWRYARHPFFKYKMFFAKEGKNIKSFIVVRIGKTDYGKFCRIIDFISTDEAEAFTLWAINQFCVRQKVIFIDFLFTGNFYRNALKKAGFQESVTEPYSRIPLRMNPIDKKVTYINFSFKIINDNLRTKRTRNVNSWYITSGDGDQDRPNPH